MSAIDNIPAEMKRYHIFCCWKNEIRNGKQTKVPYDPKTRTFAKTNEPENFRSFGEAKQSAGQYDGIALL